MGISLNLKFSNFWGHFEDPVTEDKFQSAELTKNLRQGRWALVATLVLDISQAYGSVVALLNGDENSAQSVNFLLLRLIIFAVLVLVWRRLPSIQDPATFGRVSVAVLLLVSVMFFLHQTFSPNQLPSLSFSRISLFTLFIYLLMPIRTNSLLLLASLLSFAVFFGNRYFGQATGQALPLAPALATLVILNVTGTWLHRNVALSVRSAFISSQELIEKVAQEAAFVIRQQEFIAVLAHEVRNPLAVIQAKCQLANLQLKRNLAIDAHTYENILSMVLRIQSLFDDLMAQQQVITQPQATQQVELCVHDWLDTAVHKGQWDLHHRIVISSQNTLAKLYCDPGLLHLIISNLCSNAAKFSPADSRIVLSIRVRLNEVGIRVRDYGVGIPKELQISIFEKYYRQPQHKGLHGYGFGLFISKSLAQQMNGRISLQSTVGRGSAFTIWLPSGVAP